MENGIERDLRQARSVSEYKDLLFRYQVILNGTAGTVSTGGFPSLLRAFRWYAPESGFADVSDACQAVLPALGGYLIYKARRGVDLNTYPVSAVSRMADLLAAHADGTDLGLRDDEEAGAVVAMGYYALEQELPGVTEDLLQVDPMVAAKERDVRDGAGPSLRALLERSVAERLAVLKEKFSHLTQGKNCVYNIVRSQGERCLPVIEQHIGSLLPADQDFILHGLDAFPGSGAVLAFYDRFLAANTSPHLARQVEKYRQRVRDGVKTTGWES